MRVSGSFLHTLTITATFRPVSETMDAGECVSADISMILWMDKENLELDSRLLSVAAAQSEDLRALWDKCSVNLHQTRNKNSMTRHAGKNANNLKNQLHKLLISIKQWTYIYNSIGWKHMIFSFAYFWRFILFWWKVLVAVTYVVFWDWLSIFPTWFPHGFRSFELWRELFESSLCVLSFGSDWRINSANC